MKITINMIQRGSLLAKADLDTGVMRIFGFAVTQRDGGEIRVSPPAVKTGEAWKNVVEITDQAKRKTIYDAILAEYKKAVAAVPSASPADDDGLGL